MKIGVLGTGNVGQTLGAGFVNRSHQVMIGSRDPKSEKVQAWLGQTDRGSSAGTFAEAADFGDVIVLAIGWPNVKHAIELARSERFAGKVVLDATNPLRFEAEGQPPVLAMGHTDSAGEQIQRWLPEAKVVKAFNIVGSMHMVEPEFPDGKPTMFICGDDTRAKHVAGELIETLGWPSAVDLGGIVNARYLESMAMVWIIHMINQGFDGNHAFKLLRK